MKMIINDYQLIYDGAGMHELKALTGARMDAQQALNANSKALAEYFLRKVDYTNRNAVQRRFQSAYWNESTAQRVRDDIAYIHKHCQAEIESKWSNPPLTDEQAARFLWEKQITHELGKIKSKDVNIEIRL